MSKPTKPKQFKNNVSAIPISTEIGDMIASIDDKTKTGDQINSGGIRMTIAGGTATIDHKGKKRKLELCACAFSGMTIIMADNGRRFDVSAERLVEHAIKAGLLDDELEFDVKITCRKT